MNNEDVYKKLSKSLSYWLRHRPDKANLQLDTQGWADLGSVISALKQKRLGNEADLHATIAHNDKQRFELSSDGTMIRARQGHSVAVELDWPTMVPPETLYHGTVEKFLADIMADGLKPMARHHVHLSPDIETATKVGSRRGKPVILRINAKQMHADGTSFQLTANGVWLTESVIPAYIERM